MILLTITLYSSPTKRALSGGGPDSPVAGGVVNGVSVGLVETLVGAAGVCVLQ